MLTGSLYSKSGDADLWALLLEQISEYDEIISYFRRINDIVVRRGRNERTAEDDKWLGKYAVTEIALYAAARIYGISREDVL